MCQFQVGSNKSNTIGHINIVFHISVTQRVCWSLGVVILLDMLSAPLRQRVKGLELYKVHQNYILPFSIFSRRKRFAEIHEMYDNDTIYTMPRHKRYVEEPKFDVFLNPSKKDKQEETLKNLTKRFQRVFRSMDMKNSYPALFQV